jgi:hypothetical protein
MKISIDEIDLRPTLGFPTMTQFALPPVNNSQLMGSKRNAATINKPCDEAIVVQAERYEFNAVCR